MIETQLLLAIDYFKMVNDEEDLQRALDFLAQKGFDRELKEEQKSAILQLMRGGDLLGVLPTGFGKGLIFQLLAVAKKGSIVVIKGEAIRLLRTNSSKTTFEECLANFTRRLEACGCPKKYIESSLSEVTFDSRQSALKPQKHNTAERILPFVTTYHPAVQKLKQIAMKHWSFIENQPLLKTIFKNPPIISYKRGKSLKDMLVRAKL